MAGKEEMKNFKSQISYKKFLILLLLFILLPTIIFCKTENIKSEKQKEVAKFLEKKSFSDEVIVISIATLPIFELRIAIPFAIHHYEMGWKKSYLLAILGNFLPIPFILLILKYGVNFLMRIAFFRKFFEWLFARTRKKGKLIKKYEELGLILFVMIPLPITGAWTGSVAAYLFGIKFVPSLICIFIGICCAGIIVTIFSLLGILGLIIALTVLGALFIIWIIRFIQRLKIS